MMKPKRLSRTVVYESPWVNLYVDGVRFPNGRVIERHHFLEFGKSSVVAVVEDKHREQVLLVKVCRYATGSTDWELPAGGVEADESVIEAAQREILEETGYESINHEQVYTYHPLPGIANKLAYVIRCEATDRKAAFDEDEVSEVQWFSKAQVRGMIERKEMVDGLSLIGLLLCGI
jgi:ADP-ribose pyrophosphatase